MEDRERYRNDTVILLISHQWACMALTVVRFCRKVLMLDHCWIYGFRGTPAGALTSR